MKIGDTVYWFDQNRRVYPPKQAGQIFASGGPIWKEHWRPERIVSETSRSWVTDFGSKIPKSGPHGWLTSQEEINDLAWAHDNAHRIASRIDERLPLNVLKQIAALVGYVPETDDSSRS